ncbi:MAG: MFS transporter [Rhodospirillales bacterium]|nr:MFS transporter [Rhodospirillales bacterium]
MPTRAIVLLAAAGFVSAANLRVCDPLLPQIAGELGITVGDAGAVVTAFALSYGLFQIVIGPLGDAHGKLRMVVLGCVWAGTASAGVCRHVRPGLVGAVALPGRRGRRGDHSAGRSLAW